MAFIKSRKHAAPATALLTGLALAHPAAAADATSPQVVTDAKTLPGVKVEATAGSDYRVDKVSSPKFTQPLLDTPQTITVIGKELIQEQGATTLTEALRNSPGVGTFYVGENGSTNTGDAIYMRGFDTSGSIFVDGVRDLGSISRDVFNIEQVEVTKGPDGTEYGRTAPTGAVNMVSKQPQLGRGVSASVSYGSGERKRATADWNQQFGGSAAFRLNVVGQDSGVAGRDEVKNDHWGVAPALAFGLGTPTRVYLDYLHVKQTNVPDGGVPTIGLPGYTSPDPARPFLDHAPKVDSDNFYGTGQDHDHVTADMFTAIVEHDFSPDVALHNTTRWGRTTQDYLLTSFMFSAANLKTPDPADPSTWTMARSNPNFKHQANRILTNQTNVTATIESGAVTQNLSAGVELTQEKATAAGIAALNGSTWPAASLYHPDPHVGGLVYGPTGAGTAGKTNTAAAYLFDTLKFGERWQVNAGARLDHYTTDFKSTVVCGGRGAPACGSLPNGSVVPGVDARKTGNLPNYKLGVVYKPTANGSLYANFAQSQQPPGGNTLTLSSSANSLDNPNLDPEKARTFELGTKWDLLGSKLLLTGALYRTTVSNELVQDATDPNTYYQIGKKRVQGVEITAVGKLTDDWAVSAGFTTMDTKVVTGAAVTKDGSSVLAYTPKNAFTAWTTYHLPFGLTVGGGARYSGEMKRGTDGAVGTPAYTDAYWVFDAMASYPVNPHFDLQLNVYNLFDKDYVAAINKSGYRYTPGAPRSAMLTANIRF
ncbi:catecholate siderophore receptor Fiu [Fulvimonas soli]|uniref:Catecholate siderophore receptor n=1 Tax=Fulvimonas soli TaxID=155197 RepID=A0A316IHE8_9GAMM|nr:catecholate siderophore receptor Fiu [Fulvimonas soli]PWK92096.1 catecholate siderophore receptor [Fulvimonas soli]TNY26814.1 TonB-dependent siderophore receptor [Fulvimonas soli]